ncbi:MarR family transcriptional regulator [Stappia sp. F7233]|uniref:MarR family transcriptional regulator n=1 Tax=Stappia albiluteola TaxID=2758565 RepID=A0A839AJD3_9HYPH|nr:MarR family transcriptional regulator [Stappia albiluteola]MBA5778609.1 MarR family transcriptional regulator [Stappia albiluteola]
MAHRELRGSESGTNLLLSDQLCFALHSTTHALSRVYKGVLDPLGLTYPQYLVMLVLWERSGLSVKDLGAVLYLDSGTLTPLLKRLEAAGLVIRRRDSVDERRVLIELTAKGCALRERAESVPARIGEACLSSGVDLPALKRDLEALRSALMKSGEEPA